MIEHRGRRSHLSGLLKMSAPLQSWRCRRCDVNARKDIQLKMRPCKARRIRPHGDFLLLLAVLVDEISLILNDLKNHGAVCHGIAVGIRHTHDE